MSYISKNKYILLTIPISIILTIIFIAINNTLATSITTDVPSNSPYQDWNNRKQVVFTNGSLSRQLKRVNTVHIVQ